MVMDLWNLAPPKGEKNNDHDHDYLKKDSLHIWSWSSENSISIRAQDISLETDIIAGWWWDLSRSKILNAI